MLTTRFVAVLMFISCLNCDVIAQSSAGDVNEVRIGVWYMNTDARKKLYDGVQAALADRKMSSDQRVSLVDLGYTRATDGYSILIEALQQESVDIIIGPTESDLFVRALEDRQNLSRYQVPLISPLITADVDLQKAAWFFRTNVGVNRRAQVMYDFLRKYWIRSIAVLHANTEFGRRAEAAFKAEFLAEFENTDQYISESYDPPPDIRKGLHEILKKRPEAVGVFGEREDILRILTDLDYMDERSTSYNPVLFTVLDARYIRQSAPGMYFVSVTEPDLFDNTVVDSVGPALTDKNPVFPGSVDREFDDVKALAYDTMCFVMSVLDELEPVTVFNSRNDFRQAFRNQFAAVMERGSQTAGPMTGMVFKRSINTQTPRVYQISPAGQITSVDLGRNVWQINKFFQKIWRIKNRFGILPVIGNLCILLGVIFVTTTWDLSRWYEGKFINLLKNRKMYGLLTLQFTTAFCLYFYLAETGRIQYDSLLMAIVIAMSPSALFRAKILETPWGKSIGLSKVYDQLLLKVNEGLMVAKYKDLDSRINIIAQYNSEICMRNELKSLFSHARGPEQKARNHRELEEQLQKAQDISERKKIYARQLLRRLGWQELQERRLIPSDLEENADFKGPNTWVQDSFQYCRENELSATVDKIMEQKIPASGAVRDFYTRKVDEVEGNPDDELYAKLHFLVWKIGFKDNQLRHAGLLPTG